MSHKRKALTLKQKIDLIEVRTREKLSARDLAKRFEIGKTQAASIIKNKEQLLNKFHCNINVNEKRRFLREKGSNIDRICYDWFTCARSEGIPLSGPLVKAKAKEIADKLGYTNFNASEGWLHRFRVRHNITFKATSGEAATVPTFPIKLPLTIKNESPENIQNPDETDLFFRVLPEENRTLNIKSENCDGGDRSKERFTEDVLPLSLLATPTKGDDDFGVGNSCNIDRGLKIEKEEDDDSICMDIPSPEADMFVESDDNTTRIEGFIDTYQQAINCTQQLKHFVEARGDLAALELVSKLDLHFRDILATQNIRRTTLPYYFSHT